MNAGNFDVKTDKKEKSTILKCDVYTEFRTSYYDFHWFPRPLGLDFLDDHFARSERELSWEGSLDGVRTTILLKFPFRISNCHRENTDIENAEYIAKALWRLHEQNADVRQCVQIARLSRGDRQRIDEVLAALRKYGA